MTEAAARWQGWGTALKPAWEPIILARKPFKGTVAANVQEHGTGALNIDGCRVAIDPVADASQLRTMTRNVRNPDGWGMSTVAGDTPQVVRPEGRWPANVTLDEEAAAMLDEQTGEVGGGFGHAGGRVDHAAFGGGIKNRGNEIGFGDSGGASRFFYTAKASRSEREEGLEQFDRQPGGSNARGYTEDVARGVDCNRARSNHHPTVKPLDLMQWLCRLVTPRGGLVLDPFCGSGTTGRAAVAEGFSFTGIELNPDYAAIARARITDYAPLFNSENPAV